MPHKARDLTAMDAGLSSDPYCKLSLGKERQKTKSISGTVNPKVISIEYSGALLLEPCFSAPLIDQNLSGMEWI